MALSPGMDVLEEWLAECRGTATISINPNIRPSLADEREREVVVRVERQLALANLVKISAGNLRWFYPDRPILENARRRTEFSPCLVSPTQGPEKAVALQGVAHC